jgi:hypothetical protein
MNHLTVVQQLVVVMGLFFWPCVLVSCCIIKMDSKKEQK